MRFWYTILFAPLLLGAVYFYNNREVQLVQEPGYRRLSTEQTDLSDVQARAHELKDSAFETADASRKLLQETEAFAAGHASSAVESLKDRGVHIADSSRQLLENKLESAKQTAADATGEVHARAAAARRLAEDTLHGAVNKMAETTQKVEDAALHARGSVADKWYNMKASIASTFSHLKDKLFGSAESVRRLTAEEMNKAELKAHAVKDSLHEKELKR
eukprot:GILK01015704.1.p1 GENE.GILK01015704.1~~GILK01015704.1.p1  ORF type:complete len:218 (+),score=41.56 GILK01015704.1:209-862(+)